MTIKELIEKLEELKSKYGADIEVFKGATFKVGGADFDTIPETSAGSKAV